MSIDHQKSSISIVVTIVVLVIIVVFVYLIDILWWQEKTPAEPTVPTSDRLDYVDRVGEMAIEATTINIRNCEPTPKIVSFLFGSKVTFVNDDDVLREIWFSPSVYFPVPANDQVTVDFGEWKYPGVRQYRCGSIENAGILYSRAK